MNQYWHPWVGLLFGLAIVLLLFWLPVLFVLT